MSPRIDGNPGTGGTLVDRAALAEPQPTTPDLADTQARADREATT